MTQPRLAQHLLCAFPVNLQPSLTCGGRGCRGPALDHSSTRGGGGVRGGAGLGLRLRPSFPAGFTHRTVITLSVSCAQRVISLMTRAGLSFGKSGFPAQSCFPTAVPRGLAVLTSVRGSGQAPSAAHFNVRWPFSPACWPPVCNLWTWGHAGPPGALRFRCTAASL